MMGENGLLKSMARPESVIAVLNGAMCVVELAHPRTSYANLRRVVRPTRMRVLVLLLVSLPLSAQSITADQWRTDLAVLVKELPTRHVDAFAHITKQDFETEVRKLDAQIPSLSEPQIRAGFLRIIASLRDGHTGVWSWGRLAPFRQLPLGLYWFKDGIFVVSADEAYRETLGEELIESAT